MKKTRSFASPKKPPQRAVAAPSSDEINAVVALYNQRQYAELEDSARDLIHRFPKHGFGWKVLGVLLQIQGKLNESLEAKQKSAELSPNDAEAYSNLGNSYLEQNRLEEAGQCLTQALKISPKLAVAHNNFGLLLHKLNRLDEAEASYHKALALQPDYAEAYNNYGITLQKMERFEDAEKNYRQVIALEPSHVKAHNNLGIILNKRLQLAEAERYFVKALQIDPQFADAHYNFALLLLLMGRFNEGWAQYQWFYHPQSTNLSKPTFPKLFAKQWQGEPLQGKTILIHTEQGFGDMIQFVRYAQHLQAIGAKVWVFVGNPLVELFKTVPWVDRVLSNGEQPTTACDYWVFPLALPYWFQTTLETVPVNVPYLSADEEKSAWWRVWLDKQIPAEHKRVGLMWAGNPLHQNDANRSIALAQFSVLGAVKNITFVSLQLGAQARKDIAGNAGNLAILDASLLIQDFTDSAALLSNLDLLITVDSAPAHLAGALNIPVWTLITKIPDWRWLLERSDSVWYKSMRLFRQPESGDWASVLNEVKAALAEL